MTQTQDEQKREVAQAAVQYIPIGSIVGVGTGSTANYFIDELAKIKHKIDGAVASSDDTARRLKNHQIEVLESPSTASPSAGVSSASAAA